jgi:[histone H3]-lysine36 N-dimethyltransferase SETMAR
MATVCWDEQGILLLEWLDEGRTINATHFCELLDHLRSAIKEKRRGLLSRGVLILMDNAPPHTASITQQKLKDLGFTVLPHPPYSPDLAPSDYWLFPCHSKNHSGNQWTIFKSV